MDVNIKSVAEIPLTTKAEFFSLLLYAIDFKAKRLGYHPSIFHSNRWTEFTKSELEKYCWLHIIRQHYSEEYTPRQNRMAESYNLTIIKSLITFMLDAGLCPSLWNEVLTLCVLALNQVLSHKSTMSPYELFKGTTIPLSF